MRLPSFTFWFAVAIVLQAAASVSVDVARTHRAHLMRGSRPDFDFIEEDELEMSPQELIELDARIQLALAPQIKKETLHDIASVDPSTPWDSFECSCELEG